MKLGKHRRILQLCLLSLLPFAGQLGCTGEPTETSETAGSDTMVTRDASDSEIMQAAQAQLGELLESIPQGQEQDFGFEDRADFARASLAPPYQLLGIENGQGLRSLEAWQVPVVVDGRFCVLIEVRPSANGWEPVSLGASPMAAELGELEDERRADPSRPNIDRRSILRSYKRVAEFVSFDADPRDPNRGPAVEVLPLRSARAALDPRALAVKATGSASTLGLSTTRAAPLRVADLDVLLAQ